MFDLNTLETSITIKKKTKSKIIFDCREHLPAKKKIRGVDKWEILQLQTNVFA